MFDRLLLHDAAKATLEALTVQPPQGLLVVGLEGIGKATIAAAWAARIVNHPTNIRTITPDERGTITIEVVRDLYKAARAKQDGRQVIIVERADSMSLEAQNAFLKLLEEPRPGLTFILTALQLEALLPTILSRIQHVTLHALPDSVIRQFIVAKRPGIAQSDLTQLVFLAHGRPGAAIDLLEGDTLPAQRERMQIVKQLVTAKPYERFGLIGRLATDRDNCLATLDAMLHVTEVQINSATPAQLRRWLGIATALEDAMQAIAANGNIRAQLLYLFSRY